MSPLTTRVIDLPASAAALGVVRIGVYATCLLMLLRSDLPMVAPLPFEWFAPWGPLLLVPDAALRIMLTPAALWIIHLSTCGLCAMLMLGARPFKTLAWILVLLVIVHECLAKGCNGYANHAQLGLVYAMMVLALFPCADALSIRPRRVVPSVLHAAPMTLVPFVLGLTYMAIALRRITHGGAAIYLDETIVTYVTARSLEYSAFGFDIGLIVHEWLLLRAKMKFGFVMTTIAELAAPFVILFGWRLRLAWLAIIVPFHFLSLLTMNIFFWENVILVMLFCTGLPHWIAMRRLADRLDEPSAEIAESTRLPRAEAGHAAG